MKITFFGVTKQEEALFVSLLTGHTLSFEDQPLNVDTAYLAKDAECISAERYKYRDDYAAPLINHIYYVLSTINETTKKGAPDIFFSNISELITYVFCERLTETEKENLLKEILLCLSDHEKADIQIAIDCGNNDEEINCEVEAILTTIMIGRIIKKVEDHYFSELRKDDVNPLIYRNNRFRAVISKLSKSIHHAHLGHLIYKPAESRKEKGYFGYSINHNKYNNDFELYRDHISLSNFIDPRDHGISAHNVHDEDSIIKLSELFWMSFLEEYNFNDVIVPINYLTEYASYHFAVGQHSIDIEDITNLGDCSPPHNERVMNSELLTKLAKSVEGWPDGKRKKLFDILLKEPDQLGDAARELGVLPSELTRLLKDVRERLKKTKERLERIY